jgi:putative transposase
MVEPFHKGLSISRQCDLLGVPRACYYYESAVETEYNLLLMQEIDKLYLESPSYGSRLMAVNLQKKGFCVNRKRTSRLMKLMGIEAMYPKPKTTLREKTHEKFPYLLKNISFQSPNHVWGTDITYIPLNNGFLYLVAYLDLYSRFVLSWKISNSLESTFCIEALEESFAYGKPLILNSDQGIQYTSNNHVNMLKENEVSISMSGKGRCWDNIFVERFWRSLKYEEVYLNQYSNSQEAYEGIQKYIEFYNNRRPHSSLNYYTPAEVYKIAQ